MPTSRRPTPAPPAASAPPLLECNPRQSPAPAAPGPAGPGERSRQPLWPPAGSGDDCRGGSARRDGGGEAGARLERLPPPQLAAAAPRELEGDTDLRPKCGTAVRHGPDTAAPSEQREDHALRTEEGADKSGSAPPTASNPLTVSRACGPRLAVRGRGDTSGLLVGVAELARMVDAWSEARSPPARRAQRGGGAPCRGLLKWRYPPRSSTAVALWPRARPWRPWRLAADSAEPGGEAERAPGRAAPGRLSACRCTRRCVGEPPLLWPRPRGTGQPCALQDVMRGDGPVASSQAELVRKNSRIRRVHTIMQMCASRRPRCRRRLPRAASSRPARAAATVPPGRPRCRPPTRKSVTKGRRSLSPTRPRCLRSNALRTTLASPGYI